jgi:hypothetical protein
MPPTREAVMYDPQHTAAGLKLWRLARRISVLRRRLVSVAADPSTDLSGQLEFDCD